MANSIPPAEMAPSQSTEEAQAPRGRQDSIYRIFLLVGLCCLGWAYWGGAVAQQSVVNLLSGAVGAYVAATVSAVVKSFKERRQRTGPSRTSITEVGYGLGVGLNFGLALLALAGYMLVAIYVGGRVVNLLFDPATAKFKAVAYAAFGLLAFGGILFVLRLYVRTLYGILEVISAIAFGVHLAVREQVGLNADLLFQAITAAYLVVRGMDNVHVGLKAEKADPFLRIMRWRRDSSEPS